MRKPLCILYSFAYHLIFPDFVQVCPWWFPSPWLHVYLRPQFSLMSCCIVLFVCSGVSPACFCLLCSLLSLSLSLYTFLYGLFSIYSNLFGDLYFGYDPSLNKTLSLFLKFKLLITWTCNIITNYLESQTVSVRLVWFLFLCVSLDTES